MTRYQTPALRHHGQRLAAVACALVAAAGLTACGGSGPGSGKDATISALTWGDAKYLQGQFKIYQQLYPKHAQQQKIGVTVAGQNDSDAVNKFRLELSSHQNIPDIVELNYNEVAEFASQHQLADMRPYVAAALPAMTSAAKTLMQYGGKYVAVPYEVKEKLWFYRKDMFAAAGIDPAQVRTEADFIAAGKKLRAKYPHSYMWNIAANPAGYILGELISGNGSKVYDKSGGKFVVGSDPGITQAFTAMKTLRRSGVVDTKTNDFTPDWQKALGNGTLASVPIASWFATFLPQYAPKLAGKWGVTTWPAIGGAVGGSEAGGSVFVIPAAAKNKAAAARFLTDVFMTRKGSIAVAKKFGEIPNVTAAQNDPAVTNDPYFGTALIDGFKAANADYKVFPYDPAALKEQTILQNALANYVSSGAADPSGQLRSAQRQMTAQIGNPYQQ